MQRLLRSLFGHFRFLVDTAAAMAFINLFAG